MARKKSPHLTDAELRLMDVLWEKGEATVSDVAESAARRTRAGLFNGPHHLPHPRK